MNTRKHPRTLDEAFGPYTSHKIHEPPTDYPWAWWACLTIIALFSVAATLLWGGQA